MRSSALLPASRYRGSQRSCPRLIRLYSHGGSIDTAELSRDGRRLATADRANVVFCQLVPWQFDPAKQMNLKRTFRRASCLVTRLAANMGVAADTPLLARFRRPVNPSKPERRWLEGFYLDVPEEWDDPYRFFRW